MGIVTQWNIFDHNKLSWAYHDGCPSQDQAKSQWMQSWGRRTEGPDMYSVTSEEISGRSSNTKESIAYLGELFSCLLSSFDYEHENSPWVQSVGAKPKAQPHMHAAAAVRCSSSPLNQVRVLVLILVWAFNFSELLPSLEMSLLSRNNNFLLAH